MERHIIEGTWEEIKQHEAEFAGQHLRVIVSPEVRKHSTKGEAAKAKPAQPRQLRGRGMLAGVLSSEDFMRRKHEETIREDRPLR